jgi:hypothetical protein
MIAPPSPSRPSTPCRTPESPPTFQAASSSPSTPNAFGYLPTRPCPHVSPTPKTLAPPKRPCYSVVHATRSAPAHLAHRIRVADPSLLLQSRPWSRQEAGSLAKALQNRTQQNRIGSTFHTDHRSIRKLDMNRAAPSRRDCFRFSLLVFRVRYRHRDQRKPKPDPRRYSGSKPHSPLSRHSGLMSRLVSYPF